MQSFQTSVYKFIYSCSREYLHCFEITVQALKQCLSFFQGKWPSDSLPWGKPAAELKVMVILPSTMYFTMLRNFDLSHIVIKKGFINRVCYSFHSSYTEVKDLVTYLQPKFVRPNVKPMLDETIMKVGKIRYTTYHPQNDRKKVI